MSTADRSRCTNSLATKCCVSSQDNACALKHLNHVIDTCIQRTNANLENASRDMSSVSAEADSSCTFRVRRATIDDVQSIMTLVCDLAIFEKCEPKAITTTTNNFQCDGFGPNPMFHCLLIEGYDTIVKSRQERSSVCVGMGLWFVGCSSMGRYLYLEDLVVKEEFRGRGGGRCIMQTLADIAVCYNCFRFSWLVFDWNQEARDFYGRIGAKVSDDIVTYRWNRNGMISFLELSTEESQIPVQSETEKRSFVGSLNVNNIARIIDGCLERTNDVRNQSKLINLRRGEAKDVPTIMATMKDCGVDISKKIDEEAFRIDGFGSTPLFYCILLEKPNFEVAGVILWCIGYSTRTGRVLNVEDLFLNEEQCSEGVGDVTKFVFHALSDIATSLDCCRCGWKTSHGNASKRLIYRNFGAETLLSLLNVSMSQDAMKSFSKHS
mmetsp:Transcript_57378/g.69045  ORF Transcript_57378/g.69045 Transcript_57378/m.69045 type:complete len:437 (-) Transcript_57378:203-1513(-)